MTGKLYVPLHTQVQTTLAEVDATWDKLNEYDINVKLRDKCLPPAVIKYGELGPDEGGGVEGLIFIIVFVAIFVGIAGVIACTCCRSRKPPQGQIPGAALGAAAAPPYDVPVAAPGAEMVTVGQPSLPSGWSKAIDPNTGREYYQNENTHATQWDRPVAA